MLKETGILPVVCLKNENELQTFLGAIIKAGIKCVEITLRHPFSLYAIKHIKEFYPEIIVGAGTVKNIETLNAAIESGADFCVSSGMSELLLDEAYRKGVPFLPGGATPTEFMRLIELGFKTAKYFPAECSGGISALKLYEGALSELNFLPTGGITAENFANYSLCKNVVACGGSFMVPASMLKEGDSDGIFNTINNLMSLYKGKADK